MKTKRLLSIIMAVSMLFCVLVVPATAADGGECHPRLLRELLTPF